jgi:hypothetical protein
VFVYEYFQWRETRRDQVDEAGKYEDAELTQLFGALCATMWNVFNY